MQRNTLKITNVLSESFKLTFGMKWPILLLSSTAFVLTTMGVVIDWIIIVLPKLKIISQLQLSQKMVALHSLTNQRVPISITNISTPITSFIFVYSILFLFGFITFFLSAMMVLLGVRQSVGLPLKISGVFVECKKFMIEIVTLYLIIIIAMIISKFILSTLLHEYGWIRFITHVIFYILFSLMLMVFNIFSIPLIIIKRYDAIDSIKQGLKDFINYAQTIIPTFIIISALHFLSFLTLGIGLIWTIPMFYAAIGICFRNIYGLKMKSKKASSF